MLQKWHVWYQAQLYPPVFGNEHRRRAGLNMYAGTVQSDCDQLPNWNRY